MMLALIEDIGFRAVLVFMAFSAAVGLAAGIVMVTRPDLLAVAGKFGNRWVSTRRFDRPLEKWIGLDNWFYEHHRLAGGLLLASALWVVQYFAVSFDKHRFAALLARGNYESAQITAILLDSFRLVFLAAAIFAVLFSFFLLWRPDLVRDFQRGANQWLSLRKTLKPVEIQRHGVDEYVMRHSRFVGGLLLLGTLCILAGLFFSVR